MSKQRKCRVCGCSEFKPCQDEKASALDGTPIGCHWVQKDLCNVCDDKANAVKLGPSPRSTLKDLVARRCLDLASAKPGPGGHKLDHSQLLYTRGLIERDYDGKIARTIYYATRLGREVARRAA